MPPPLLACSLSLSKHTFDLLTTATTTPVIFAYFSSVFNGFFAWLIGLIPATAPLHKWQYLYLLTGTINVLYSALIFFVLPDSPMNARFLSPAEKYYATQRLAANRTGIANRTWKWDQVREAVLDVKVWLIVLFNIAINIPNGGLSSFGSIIIHNLGFSSLKASLLTMPFGVLATSSAWLFSYWAARWTNRRTVVAAIALILPIIGTAVVYATSRTNLAAQMVGLYFMYFYWRMSLCPKAVPPQSSPNPNSDQQPRMSSASPSPRPIQLARRNVPSSTASCRSAMRPATSSVPRRSAPSRRPSTPAPLSPCSPATASASC